MENKDSLLTKIKELEDENTRLKEFNAFLLDRIESFRELVKHTNRKIAELTFEE